MFKLTFLTPLADKPEITEKNAGEVLAFCHSIDWLQEFKNYYKGYRSWEELINYNEYWYLEITNTDDQSVLLIEPEYMDEREIVPDKLRFVITYSWMTLVKASWLGKVFSGKEEKTKWMARHLPHAEQGTMLNAVQNFIKGDLISLKSDLNYQGVLIDNT